MTYLFIGEKRSNKAIAMSVTWESEALAAIPLFEALRKCGIDPRKQVFRNAYKDGDGLAICEQTMRLAQQGRFNVVALGQIAHNALVLHGIEHLVLTHPAARGKIRKRARYIQHVKRILGRSGQ